VKFHARIFQIAPGLLGAFLLSLGGCERKDQAGDWAAQTPPPSAGTPAAAVEPPEPTGAGAIPIKGSTVRFVVFNVRNWLTMERYIDGQLQPGRPKPEKERLALTRMLARETPDILGISEVGTEEDVKDLQGYLERAGHSMPHFHLNRGVDPTRSLVILSRFPIGRTIARGNLTYRSNRREHGMQRGILDATIQTPAGAYRFLGVHLKSKLDTETGDQDDMRLQEAHLLRREIDAILRDDPRARLVVYGDFNDTRNSSALRAARGAGNSPRSLEMIGFKDSKGESWTHHWEAEDVYSRIDYVMVSDSLRKSVDWDRCKIVDSEELHGASDHRPLLVILK
jgi:endonuclease/exonuclease/phosphatase family metal-dependent hydrolase